uniref:Tight adherence protein C n=1 Tax=uncultured Chloroflexota bacterium TaxID=166587 RepID=H5S9B3_9CHLR|nr:tight adherence protein C [uncultured Chloroflexota bacterium]
MSIWLVLGFLLLVVVAGVVVAGVRVASQREQGGDPILARLAELGQSGTISSLEEIELQQPFRERVILPFLNWLGEFSLRFTPQSVQQNIELQLEMAGRPYGLDATSFLAFRLIMPTALAGFFLFLFSISPAPPPLSRRLLIITLLVFTGFLLPGMWLRSQISRRQRDILKSLPDALDLLTICVEAGIGLEAAMSKVAEKWQTALSYEFFRVIREIQLGVPRHQALRGMAKRVGLPEMNSFVSAVIQSDTLGVSIAKVLRIQADQMRMRRRQRAEELANQAPVKMVPPMVFLIFPSIFIILLTPAMIQIIRVFSNVSF